jgi:hypothetical protein
VSVTLPPMTPAQTAGWRAMLDLYDIHSTGWTLVGGQMVHLHCAERGGSPARPTDDLDAVLDVRAEPNALLTFTTALTDMGFTSDGETWTGHHHRWVRGEATIDVLIPRSLGERAAQRTGASGGTTLETPGAQQALNRTEDVDVVLGGRAGTVRRPNLLGALVAKAAAHTVSLDPARRRHVIDFAVLSTLIRRSDDIASAGTRDRRYLEPMIRELAADRRAVLQVEGAQRGLDNLKLLLDV